MDQQQQLDPLDEQYIERLHLMAAMTDSEAGISFLQWLCRLSGFNKPIMSLEDASRRDIWLTIRPFVPVEKLGEIEHHDLREQQQMLRGIMDAAFKEDKQDD